MPDLRILPRPEGFELRDKRSSKHCNAADWTPQDALYDASQVMGDDAQAALILWRDKAGVMKFRAAGPQDSSVALCVSFLNARG